MTNSNKSIYPKVGTTNTIIIPKSDNSTNIKQADSYFFVKIHAAQAALIGVINWGRS